jgi:hypothetical protein
MLKYGPMNPILTSKGFGLVEWSRNKVKRYETDTQQEKSTDETSEPTIRTSADRAWSRQS